MRGASKKKRLPKAATKTARGGDRGGFGACSKSAGLSARLCVKQNAEVTLQSCKRQFRKTAEHKAAKCRESVSATPPTIEFNLHFIG